MNIIDKIKKYKEDIIYIVGHKNADVDSILSCLLLEKHLRMNNINAKALIIDTDKESVNLVNKYFPDLLIEETEININAPIILVDHYSDNRFRNIVGCIDHHPTAGKLNYDVYINKNASSCCKLIYDLFIKNETKEDILMVLFSIYMDTISCRSDKFIISDKQFIENKKKQYGLSLEEYEKEGLCLTPLDAPIAEIAENGQKEYTFGYYNVACSYIQVDRYDVYTLLNALNYLLERKDKFHFVIFKVDNVELLKSIFFVINKITGETIKIDKDTLVSRGSFMRAFEERLA